MDLNEKPNGCVVLADERQSLLSRQLFLVSRFGLGVISEQLKVKLNKIVALSRGAVDAEP